MPLPSRLWHHSIPMTFSEESRGVQQGELSGMLTVLVV